MQLREVRATGSWEFSLALHPRLTVVTGLGPLRRAQLAARLQAAVSADVPGLLLLVETDQGPQPLRAADLATAGWLRGTSIVLRPRDLPGAVVVSSARPGDSSDDLEPERVTSARHGLQLAREAELVRSQALRQIEAEAPGPAPGTLDVDAARRRLHHAERARQRAEDAVAEAGGPAAVALRMAAVDALRDEQLQLQSRLAVVDGPVATSSIEEARRALRDAVDADGPVSVAARALADRWSELERRWRDASWDDRTSHQLEPARARVELARVELARAEQYAKPLYVNPVDRAQLDEAHEQVLQLQDRADRKLAGPLVRRKLDAARAVELGILQRIGVSSYDAYLLRTSPGLGDADAADRLAQARQRLEEAEAGWEIAQDDEPEEARTMRRERSLILAGAAELLGRVVTDDEVETALRSHRDPPDVAGLSDALRRALEEAGVVVHSSLEDEADRWLDQRRADVEQRRRDEARLAEVGPELAAAEGALDAARAMGDARSAEESDRLVEADEALRTARDALAEMERTAAAATEHAERVALARRDLARAERRRTEAEGELAHAEAVAADGAAGPQPPVVTLDEVDLTGVDLDAAEVYVLARIAGLRDVGDVGAVPLVLDEPFLALGEKATASMLGLLERVGSVIQVLYLTEDPAVVEWGRLRAPEHAAVRHFAPS